MSDVSDMHKYATSYVFTCQCQCVRDHYVKFLFPSTVCVKRQCVSAQCKVLYLCLSVSAVSGINEIHVNIFFMSVSCVSVCQSCITSSNMDWIRGEDVSSIVMCEEFHRRRNITYFKIVERLPELGSADLPLGQNM